MTKELALTELLAKLYPTPETFIRFLSSLKGESDPVSRVTFTGPMRNIVFDAVDQIRLRGLIDADLFEYLLKESSLTKEIAKVRDMWLTGSGSRVKLPSQETKKVAKKSPVVFVSYSLKDANFYEELETHLTILELKGLINIWQEGRIEAGEEWDKTIKSQFEKADILILLVSADFLASKFLYDNVLISALKRPDKEKRIIPVIIRQCFWQRTLLNSIQVFPLDGKPIALSDDPDRQWVDLSNTIKRLVLNWRGSV